MNENQEYMNPRRGMPRLCSFFGPALGESAGYLRAL